MPDSATVPSSESVLGSRNTSGLGVERSLAVQHGLVLSSVVAVKIVIIPEFSRSSLPGISPQLGQAGTHRLAERNLIQVILRHGIFGSDPGGRLFRTVVFEPAVGVGDFGAEVVIHDFRTLGIGIRQVFDFHR